uniref:MSP domain-containing protein n=1 Tax=Haemonchus contortus TaxID=6289 RepID=A0A7I4Y7V3_HAECO
MPIVKSYEEYMKNRIFGDMPDEDLICRPRWLMFHSTNSYKNPCFGEITVMNRNPYPVAWCFKSKEKMMRIWHAYGVLQAGEHMEVTIYLISSDDWPREVVEYTGKRHKIVAECLKIPDYIRPSNNSEAARIAREIFHYSSMFNPLQRMYTKINLLLE